MMIMMMMMMMMMMMHLLYSDFLCGYSNGVADKITSSL